MTPTNSSRIDPAVDQPWSAFTLLRRITNFFHHPEPVYHLNSAWNDPITNDADGMFHFYFQNTHGLPRDMVSLNHDLSSLQEFDISCFSLAETNLNWH
jgi:hypothetical protein